MAKKLYWLTFLVILAAALVVGCGEMGKVDQGRAVATDKTKQTVTIIRDIKHELGKPEYDQLPPVTFEFPKNPAEMGPTPKAGKLMAVDPDKKEITIFDDANQTFKVIAYNPIDVRRNVGLRDAMVAGKKFPIIDRTKKTITVYDKRKRLVTTFSLPEQYFALPDETFGFGDEVRIYYKEPTRAARLMNISETDIYKK